ncbi:MBL fold metallo-hydrolase [Halapricum desulfuricans]|uniref:Metal-dependent hydrolase of the beta-lactamase superfamily II n=1 Tax=Halapricum desulfuricans TaxID=2841257 RepID=A0A897N9Y2_9EURY|nr:MBL fold metallo-hydrolase [Halapricum desulfuricans]QSG07196.1 Metal-dependent hydrolase of the beta-lactamase superfamily II [Halapricum desulfuricans]
MAEQLRPGVWLLDVGLVRPVNTNSYLVDDGTVTLIDTGLWVNCPSLHSELAAAGYDPSDVDRVLLTHYDLDHTTGLGRLEPRFDGPVYIGRRDYDLATGGFDPPLVHHKGLFHRLVRPFFPIPAGDVRPVADGERIGEFTAFDTPGHNPGHVAYVHDSGAAFVGDLLWGGEDGLTTPVWLDSYDMDELRESVVDFYARAPPFEVLAMGHGTPITTGARAAYRELLDRL